MDRLMFEIQLVLILVIPVVMCVNGNNKKKSLPEFGGRSIVSHISICRKSERIWNSAADMYYSLLFISGLNVGLATVVVFILIAIFAETSWIVCATFVIVQLIAGILLPLLATSFMMKRIYNKDGEFIDKEAAEKIRAEEEIRIAEFYAEKEKEKEAEEDQRRRTEELIAEYEREVENGDFDRPVKKKKRR